jgi:hypothetical protein
MAESETTGGGRVLTAADVDRACATCVLWSARLDPAKPLAGHCHRFPPQSPEGERIYPVTTRADWCGGHIRAAEDTHGFANIGGQP